MSFVNELIQVLQELWALILPVAIGIGALFRWRYTKKKQSFDSIDEAYNKMAELREKIVKQVTRDIEHATTIARQKALLAELQTRCPECYKRVIKLLNHED
jgi:predicted negative regulator of RcsB-dependent stress response